MIYVMSQRRTNEYPVKVFGGSEHFLSVTSIFSVGHDSSSPESALHSLRVRPLLLRNAVQPSLNYVVLFLRSRDVMKVEDW
jgi:hypothetical protein